MAKLNIILNTQKLAQSGNSVAEGMYNIGVFLRKISVFCSDLTFNFIINYKPVSVYNMALYRPNDKP